MDENGFSRSQLDNLYWCFSQCEHMEDPVGGIIEMYKASYSATKTRLSVIQVGFSLFFPRQLNCLQIKLYLGLEKP